MVANPELVKPDGVRRLVYKELLPGDYRKLAGQSNDADTGGGARDLRFPYAEFDGIFARLLPGQRNLTRRRNGKRIDLAVRTGPVLLDEEAPEGVRTTQEEMIWESPTDSRPREGRIAQVHASPAAQRLLLAREEMVTADGQPPRVFALFVQNDDGELSVHYAYEHELRAGAWAPAVARPMLEHLDNINRRRDRAVIGYIDFVTNIHYAHDVR